MKESPSPAGFLILFAIGLMCFAFVPVYADMFKWDLDFYFFLGAVPLVAVGIFFICLGFAALKHYKKTKATGKEPTDLHFNKPVMIASGIVVSIGIIIAGAMIIGDFFSSLNSGPEYETYYQDDNGNGELDQGEWNYTVDENGNTVDIDNDGSNFE